MRILGAILIVVGLVFCLTIIGLGIGLFLIFVGIILFAVGGRRKTIITNVVNVHAPAAHVAVPETVTPAYREINPTRQLSPSIGTYVEHQSDGDYDKRKWQALLKYDPDIGQVAEKLRSLGDYWVDEFAKSYLAINDKTYLPNIVSKIIADARSDSNR
jgi:hypothetical protein